MKFSPPKPIYFIVLGIIIGLAGFFLILANPFGLNTPKPFLTTKSANTNQNTNTTQAPQDTQALPTPYLVLPKGKQTYTLMGGDTDFSKVTSITVDPLDVQKGASQTISVSITSPEPVASVSIKYLSDNQEVDYSLKLTFGTADKGVWSVSLTSPDSVEKLYTLNIAIKTNTNKRTDIPFLIR